MSKRKKLHSRHFLKGVYQPALVDAIISLITAFNWADSPQGFEAWENVVRTLEEINALKIDT